MGMGYGVLGCIVFEDEVYWKLENAPTSVYYYIYLHRFEAFIPLSSTSCDSRIHPQAQTGTHYCSSTAGISMHNDFISNQRHGYAKSIQLTSLNGSRFTLRHPR